MNDLTIRLRLILTVAFLIVLMVVIGVLGLRGITQSNAGLETVYVDRTVPMGQLAGINDDMRAAQEQLLLALQHDPNKPGHISHDQSDGVASHGIELKKHLDDSSDDWKAYLATYLTPEEKVLATQYDDLRKDLLGETLEPAVGLIAKEDYNGLDALVAGKSRTQLEAARETMSKLMQLQLDVAKQEYETAVDRFKFVRIFIILTLLGAMVIGGIAGWLLLRAISVPLQEALALASRIAEGNLTGDIQANSTNEIGRLLAALKQMKERLFDVVRQVKDATGTISHAAREIASGNMDLSQRTEQQASSLEETASAMEQMTSTVKLNSDNARQANQLANATREQADHGGQVVTQAITAMADISSASTQIANIIGVIDEIAFQTNLLALNAAVEAARAGEQGRGFAVVATEVRNLAQRSATAAKEIKTLIQDSVAKVNAGSELVNRSGATLTEIVQGAKKVSDIVAEIAAASLEQATGIDEVGKAVMQMDNMTQQNAALVEQAAAAAKEMETQSMGLDDLMRFFKTDGGSAASVPRVATTATVHRMPAAARPPAAAKRPTQDSARARLAARSSAPPQRALATSAAESDKDWDEF